MVKTARFHQPISDSAQQIDRERLLAQELVELRCHPLDHRIDWINLSIVHLDRIAREKVEYQQPGPRLVVTLVSWNLISSLPTKARVPSF